MRLSVAIATLLFSLPSFAASFQSKLDLNALYGGFSAGQYNVSIQVEPVAGQPTAPVITGLGRDEGMTFCQSSVEFVVGTMNVTVSSADGKWASVKSIPLKASVSATSEDKVCTTPVSTFEGNVLLQAPTWAGEFELPVAAPKGYNYVRVSLSPFAMGLVLSAETKMVGGRLTLVDPSAAMAWAFANPAVDSTLGYYVTATQLPGTYLSMGMGKAALARIQ